MEDLKEYRAQIDRIDRQLADLFQQRMDVVDRVGRYKQAHGLPVLDAAREKEVLAAKAALARDEGMAADLVALFEHIMAIARRRQHRLSSLQTDRPGRKNIVLIGMPGCGKTSVGEELSRQLGMPLVDTDRLIEEEQGCSVPDIFTRVGEPAFRDMETVAARRAAAMERVIIATGGGMVLREENMQMLSETGVVFFRDRELSAIAGEDHGGRPLIGEDKQRLSLLYRQRIGLYRKYAQYIISNTDTVKSAAEQIVRLYRKECGQ